MLVRSFYGPGRRISAFLALVMLRLEVAQ